MTLMGIGSNNLSSLPNDHIPDSNTGDTGKEKFHTTIHVETVCLLSRKAQ